MFYIKYLLVDNLNIFFNGICLYYKPIRLFAMDHKYVCEGDQQQ